MFPSSQIQPEDQKIWLFDRREHWRRETLCALRGVGFDVQAWPSYEYPPPGTSPGQVPDLVIVQGTRMGDEEEGLARRILKLGHPLLVVSGRVPIPLMRTMFRAGARDVVEAAPDHRQMVDLVERSLLQGLPMSSYEAVIREGVE